MGEKPHSVRSRPTAGGPDGELLRLFGYFAGILRRSMSRRLAAEPWVREAGHRPPAFAVLSCIERMGPVSQKQISNRLGADPSDLVAIFDALEEGGFVSRERDPRDRRRYALTLTPRGHRQLGRFKAVAAELQDELLAPLDADERAVLHRLLQRVVDHHAAHVSDDPEA